MVKDFGRRYHGYPRVSPPARALRGVMFLALTLYTIAI